MNVLQRRMFQTGGPSDKLIQVEPVNSELVRYYVQQGYSPLEIQEVYPAANLGLIEQIAREEGGSLNPAVSLGESFTGSPVVTPAQRADIISESISTPVGNLSFEASADPELPNLEDVSVVPKSVRDYITNAGGVLDRANLVRGLGVSFGMSEAEANSAIDLVTGSTVPERTTVDTPGLPGLADVMTGEQAEVASSVLGPNQYRASDGKVYNVDPKRFAEILNSENVFEIQALIQNPEVEYGSNLQEAIRDTIGRRAASFSSVSPSTFKFGEMLPDYLNLQTGLRDIAGVGIESLAEFGEGLYNLGRRGLAGFIGEREADTGDRDIFKGERYPMGEDKFIGGFEQGLLPEKSGGLRMGIPAADLDSLVLRSSTGQVEQPVEDEIGKELQDLENQEQADKVNAEAAGSEIEDAVADETQADAEDVADTVTDEEGDKTEEQKKSDAEPPVVSSASTPEQVGTVFNNPDFISYVANLSKGIAKTGEVGSGLALGSALAAEERSLRDLEKEKADREFLLKAIESGQSPDLTPSDIGKLDDMTYSLNENIKNYEGSRASVAIMNDAISLFEEAVEKGVAITGLPGRINRFKDQAAAFMGASDSNVSDATKIANYIEQVKQRSIRDILNESGRTISNLDREIVDRVFGDLNLTDKPSEILKKLKNARRSLIDSNLERQRNVKKTYRLLQNPVYGNVGIDAISPYRSIIEAIINASPSDAKSMTNVGEIFDLDMRGEFNQ